MYYILTNGREPTPFHVMVKAVYSLMWSKELVTALNHCGICVSYKTVKQIDVDLAEWYITTADDNRLPLPLIFKKTSRLNGAVGIF